MSVDPDALAEAVEYLTVGQGSANLSMAGIKKPDWDALAVSVSANRAVLEAPTAEWCFEHGVANHIGHRGRVEEGENPCRIGRVRLVAERSQ